MMRFLAFTCAPTRQAYIVTANVPALHLALHQDLLYCRAEDNDVVDATLYGGTPRLISALAPVHCAARESLSRGDRGARAAEFW